jgi:hypothetical protein
MLDNAEDKKTKPEMTAAELIDNLDNRQLKFRGRFQRHMQLIKKHILPLISEGKMLEIGAAS